MDALGVDANFIFQDERREHYEGHATTEEMETLVKKYRQLDEHGVNYAKTREVYVAYRKAGYSKKFRGEYAYFA